MARKKRSLKRTLARVAAREKEGKRLNRPHDDHLMQMAGSVDAQPYERDGGKTYGQRVVTSKRRYFKITRANLIEMVDDAYGAGDAEKGKWASGVIEAKNREIKEAHKTTDDYAERMARAELLCALLMEKHGYPRN